jgi:hypothetical protein
MESQAKALSEQTVETIQKSNSLLEQLSGYKTYLYILLVVLVLSAIGYYLYIKHFKTKDVKTDVSTQPKKEILNPNTEYYIVDAQGNPILVNQYFGNMVQSAAQQRAVMINPQIPVQQVPVEQKPQQRPKLSHTGDKKQNKVVEEDENVDEDGENESSDEDGMTVEEAGLDNE